MRSFKPRYKTVVIGSKSFIGQAFLQSQSPPLKYTHHRTSKGAFLLDLQTPSLDALQLQKGEYQYGLITASIPNIAFCEENTTYTYQCNVEGTLSLVEQLLEKEIIPILFSTDYVFDGTQGMYTEQAPLNPLNEYGRQKAELEQRLPEICGKQFLLLRLSKVFGTRPDDGSLIDEMMTSLLQSRPIKAAFDQIFCPIHIDDLTQGIIELQNQNQRGLFNIGGKEILSRHALASKVAQYLNINPDVIEKISLNDLQESFKRPKCTALCSDKFYSKAKLNPEGLSSQIIKLANLRKR